jgi:hypothetical protein
LRKTETGSRLRRHDCSAIVEVNAVSWSIEPAPAHPAIDLSQLCADCPKPPAKRCRRESGAQTIPPTLQQSLAARLDRLGEAREVAQIGAVMGREFPFHLLSAIAGMAAAELNAALEKLADADLVFVESIIPDSRYRFKHALIQEAA